MSTTILRFEKIKSFESIRCSSSHIFRYSDTPNADPNKYSSNRVLIGGTNTEKTVKRFIEHHNIKVRKNAVLAMDGLITLSPDAFKTVDATEKFTKAATEYIKRTFKGRCISAVLHLDESTPHIHFTVIPAEKHDNKVKLNARKLFSKSSLSNFQKSFFEHMNQSFDLVPPQHGKKARHTKIQSFYAELEKDVDELRAKMLDNERTRVQQVIDEQCPDVFRSFWKKLDSIVDRKSLEIREDIGGHSLELIRRYKDFKEYNKFDIENAVIFESNEELDMLMREVENKIMGINSTPNLAKNKSKPMNKNKPA